MRKSKVSKDIIELKNKRINRPTFVVGLPGIGNVGKIVTDYVIEQLNAKELGKFYIDTPPMVFPTKEGIEFPSVKLYHSKLKNTSFLFIAGDYQPREAKCFEFCSKILDLFKNFKGNEIIILGGASLPEISQNPSVYAVASRINLIEKYKKIVPGLKSAHGSLGPIVGVAGVLLGLAKDKGVNATAFLTETTDKEYFNSKSVKKTLELLNRLTGIEVNTKKFGQRIKDMDKEISTIKNLMAEERVQLSGQDDQFEEQYEEEKDFDVGYIG